jgi:hypothetical protein
MLSGYCFTADMTPTVSNGQLTMRRETSGYDRRRRVSQNKPVYNVDLHVMPNVGTVLECVNSRCTYRGERDIEGYELELAEAALRARLAGHAAGYRLRV